jgi:hypothetical protein
MTAPHEHAFFAHEDPRWLICECGQYAVRTRTIHGQATFRLIDPPKPIFAAGLCPGTGHAAAGRPMVEPATATATDLTADVTAGVAAS